MTTSFLRSSIGKKWIVGLTGLVLFLFVIGHMLGNLQIFISQNQFNHYAETLQNLGELLWAVRIFLIFAIVIHIVFTILLTIQNKQANPQKYAVSKYRRSTFAARTMATSGLIVLAFLIFHLLEFTFMKTHPEYRSMLDGQGRHDVYHMVIASFQQPGIALFYLLGVFLLALHLSHGAQSFVQSLGLNSKFLSHRLVVTGRTAAWLLFAGYAVIPIAVQLHHFNR